MTDQRGLSKLGKQVSEALGQIDVAAVESQATAMQSDLVILDAKRVASHSSLASFFRHRSTSNPRLYTIGFLVFGFSITRVYSSVRFTEEDSF